MYSSDLYSQDDIVSTVPPYEIEPHGIIVASEEVVYSSPDKRTIENDTVTRNYSIVGGGGCETDRNGFLSSRMDLKVAVIRKIGFGSANSNPWFPKKVIVTTSKRRIETVAWAHSSDNLTSRLKSTSPVGHIEDDARDSPAMVIFIVNDDSE
ncbi:hypothetical protein Y032_0207g2051 [Ancylostoma ceylanicum]|uniref:Uncharacterized protein n=1 Tax=Ancylostoma ceylanicum TaxID=53326 RepID=A0A016SLZ4_9BILA|nr:hypothetical protein Y032_0207g2051 [Ancylostoma ceylanicum]